MGGLGFASLAETAFLQRLGTIAATLEGTERRLITIFGTDKNLPLFPELEGLVDHATEVLQLEDNQALYADLRKLLSWNVGTYQPSDDDKVSFRSIQERASEIFRQLKSREWTASFQYESDQVKEAVASASKPESGRSLNAVTAYRPNQIEDKAFIIFIRRRLCLPLVPARTLNCSLCGRELDENMEHAFTCLRLGHGNFHQPIKLGTAQVFRDLAKHSGNQVVNEPTIDERYLRDIPENKTPTGEFKSKRADVSLANVVKKTTTMIDVRTCAITSYTAADGVPVTKGEAEKHQDYNKKCHLPKGMTLLPFAIDTQGRWGDEFTKFLSAYCKSAAPDDTKLYNFFISRARNTIGVAHAQAVGSLIERAILTCVNKDDIHLVAIS